jgi:hypothetical protein
VIEPRHLDPSSEHAHLLRAALHVDRVTAQRSLEAWQAGTDLEDLDATSLRLLSLLADRLDQLDVDEDLRTRIATIVRFTWLRTQALLGACRPALADLADGDVPFLVLKGAALLGADARGLGRRQLDDVDLLVPVSAVPRVTVTLRGRGFDSPLADGLIARPRQHLTATHSTAFSKGQAEIDLHWRAAPLARRPDVEEQRWFDARIVEVAGVPVGIPSATEMLLLTLEHDAVPTASGSGRWVGDAATLLASGDLEGQRLAARAQALGIAAVLDHAVDLFEDLTGRPLAGPRRRRPPSLAARALRDLRAPRAVEAGELWQRHRAVAQPGWRGTARAAAATWSGLGGPAALRTLAKRPVPSPGPGAADAERDPWAWACRRVDLSFGVGDDGVAWLGSGWSSPEPGFTWTDAPHADLIVPAEVAPAEPLVLDLVSHGLVSDRAGTYEVRWSVDDTPVAVQRVTTGEPTWWTIRVPAGVAAGGTVRLGLDVRWPRSAAQAGTGTDLRRLGIGLSWLRLMSRWSPRPVDDPEP